MISNDEKQWAMLCHLAALSGFIGVPCGNVLGPLAVWLWKRNDSPYIDRHGKESLNFHLAMLIYLTAAAISLFFLVGFIILPVVYIMGLICTVIGAIKASNGEHYMYPLSIQFVS
ncbi:DUF4870 domain-containing protein [bacterium]|nr:MAG: DUF4870 domain-containing protein [bacterium]